MFDDIITLPHTVTTTKLGMAVDIYVRDTIEDGGEKKKKKKKIVVCSNEGCWTTETTIILIVVGCTCPSISNNSVGYFFVNKISLTIYFDVPDYRSVSVSNLKDSLLRPRILYSLSEL